VGPIAGVLLVLLGAATAFLGLTASTSGADGARRRGVLAILAGLAAATLGCWLLGALA